MSNIYYSPEKFGLEAVAQIEYSDRDYVFDIRIVWKDKNGKLYTARDSGCSCPVPFEDIALADVNCFSYDTIRSEVHQDTQGNASEEQKQEFLRKIREATS